LPKPPAAKAPAAPATPVDKVIELVKGGLGDDMVIRAIGKEGLHADLTSADMLKLKKAGVSEKVMSAMLESPAAAPAPAPAAVAPAMATSGSTPDAVPASAAAPPPAPVPAAANRSTMRKAAIDEFDWATVRTAVAQVFGTTVDVGKGLRSLLVQRVQQGGKVRVVERQKANTIMSEQDFGASNRVKQGSNARIGQMLGADVYLMGDIVAFGRDDRRKGVALGGLGVTGPLAGVVIGGKEDKAIIIVNYRLVDAESGEVLQTGEAKGESKRKSKGLGGVFGWNGGVVGGAVDMTSSNFAETIIGEAVIDAADKLAVIVNDKAATLAVRQVDIEARVAAVTGNQVTIAAGSNQGVVVGDRFDVFRIVNVVKDPVTGEVLDNEVAHLGELVIATVREKIATGTYTGSAVTTKDGLVRKRQ